MPINLFVDNERDPPKDGRDWTVARTSSSAIRILAGRDVVRLSLDYDLDEDQDGDKGMAVVTWLRLKLEEDPEFPWPEWRIHSANPFGSARMRRTMVAIAKNRAG